MNFAGTGDFVSGAEGEGNTALVCVELSGTGGLKGPRGRGMQLEYVVEIFSTGGAKGSRGIQRLHLG